MAGEDVDGQPVPLDARLAHALLHEDLAVEVPEGAAERERLELDVLDGVARQDDEAGALDRQEHAGAPRVERVVVGDVGRGAAERLVVRAVPDLLIERGRRRKAELKWG